MSNETFIIRNYDIIKNLFDEIDTLTNYYKLSSRDIRVVHAIALKHNSFNAYIEITTKDLCESRRVIYRALDKLENECIINIVNRPKNQYEPLQLYFTFEFIKRICGKEYAKEYKRWFKWQMTYKKKINKN